MSSMSYKSLGTIKVVALKDLSKLDVKKGQQFEVNSYLLSTSSRGGQEQTSVKYFYNPSKAGKSAMASNFGLKIKAVKKPQMSIPSGMGQYQRPNGTELYMDSDISLTLTSTVEDDVKEVVETTKDVVKGNAKKSTYLKYALFLVVGYLAYKKIKK